MHSSPVLPAEWRVAGAGDGAPTAGPPLELRYAPGELLRVVLVELSGEVKAYNGGGRRPPATLAMPGHTPFGYLELPAYGDGEASGDAPGGASGDARGGARGDACSGTAEAASTGEGAAAGGEAATAGPAGSGPAGSDPAGTGSAGTASGGPAAAAARLFIGSKLLVGRREGLRPPQLLCRAVGETALEVCAEVRENFVFTGRPLLRAEERPAGR